MVNDNAFLPSFGNKPKHIIGRRTITSDFIDGLSCPIGHRNRAIFLIGQRGTGKTTLLLEFAEIAAEKGFVSARVAASGDMLDEIIQSIQKNGERFIPKQKQKVKGVSVGAFGFSIGLTFSEEAEKQLGFRMKLSLLCEELGKQNKGVVILVDEVQSNTPEMRTLATAYQHLVGENNNIAVVMAGLPGAISAVLNDDILTFLNRAYKVYLEPLPFGEISIAYTTEFTRQGLSINSKALQEAVEATKGYPYLYQLIGYYITGFSANTSEITSDIVERAVNASKRDMVESVFNPALKSLSPRDKDFLTAMSKDTDDSKISDIKERMKASQSYTQKYRTRLKEAGVIEPIERGKVAFAVPYLGEYLRGEF